MRFLLPLLLVACNASWSALDADGDGVSIAQGDCNDKVGAGEGIGPNEPEIWYDGVDQNCDGLNDFDKDGDGTDAAAYGGDDCWDDPESVPADQTAINGFPQPGAADVNPRAPDPYYDGVDQDCNGSNDFDQDGDGYESATWPSRSGPGDDCYDAVEDGFVNDGALPPEAVYPGAADAWYDGTDADCVGNDDYDQDGDGFPKAEECDDEDPTVYPNEDIEEIWYNHYDENCDGNDGDQDGDGFLVAGYVEADPPIHFGYGEGDCWDDPTTVPTGYDAVNGLDQPAADEVFPGALETWYDGVDGDCAVDDDFDQDADGFDSLDWPDRAGVYGDDCDDADGSIYPDAIETWYDGVDADCDNWSDYDQDRDGHDYDAYRGDDCDDSRATVNPDRTEDCGTSYDDDCSGVTDDEDAIDCTDFYYDGDGDTYGTTASECWCLPQTATNYDATVATDCNDAQPTANPGAAREVCSTSYDDDCDGTTDEQNATGCTTFYYDADGDAYGTTTGQCWCLAQTTSNYDATVSTDCDDTRNTVNPAASEVCDSSNRDEDCDGTADNNDSSAVSSGKTRYYPDDDGDEYGDETDAGTLYCDDPSSGSVEWSLDNSDCDDAAAGENPGATEVCDTLNTDEDCDGNADDNDTSVSSSGKTNYYTDADGDTYGAGTAQPRCDTAAGLVTNATDCDDTRSAVNPAASEVCDSSNRDEDCDGVADNNDSSAGSSLKTRYYPDDDGDEYGDSSDAGTLYCDDPSTGSVEWAATATDCNDASAGVNPGATEVCDASNTDEDCDSLADDNDSSVSSSGKTSYYTDADGDTYGTGSATLRCDSASGLSTNATDCDDTRAAVNPAATEVCDSSNRDEDCDGLADDNDSSVSSSGKTSFYTDADGDTYGAGSATLRCDSASGYATNATDCDDTRSAVNPGASEVCDSSNRDEDCDGNADDNDASTTLASKTTFYLDGDGDGYGGSTTSSRCDASATYLATSTDCDDANSAIKPGAADATDGTLVDNDCDGLVDEDGLVAGDVVLTEFFVSQVAANDWVEIYNASGVDLNLVGWRLTLCYNGSTNVSLPVTCSATDTLTITGDLLLDAGEYLVFCADATIFSPAACDYDYAYSSITSANGMATNNGGFTIGLPTLTIDDIDYWHTSGSDVDWPSDDANQSVQLDSDIVIDAAASATNDECSTDNTNLDIWCKQPTQTTTTDYAAAATYYGTPGAANEVCP